MMKEALDARRDYRQVLNSGNVNEIKEWISDDFIGYFGYYTNKEYEIYRGNTYKADNLKR